MRSTARWRAFRVYISADAAKNASGPQIIVSTNCTGLIGAGVAPTAPNSAFNVVCPFRYGPRVTGNGVPDINNFSSWGGNLTVSHDFGFATLKSVTGVRGFDDDLALDLSGNPAAPLGLTQYLRQKQTSQELQLASNARSGLRWIAGVFVFGEEVDQDALFSGVRNLDTQKARSQALFGEVYVELVRGLTLTAGGRWSRDHKEIDRRFFRPITATTPVATLPPGDNSFDASKFTPRFALDYKLAPDVLLYASAGSGYRAGGFAAARPTSAAQLSGQFDNETAETVELGFKSELLNRTVRFNAAVFGSQYKNLQSSVLGADGSFTVVSGDVEFRGFEIETAWRPMPALTLYALAGFLEDEWTRPPANVPTAVRLKHVPRQQYKVGGDWRVASLFGGEVSVAANYRYSDEIYRSTANHRNILSPAYGLLDAQVQWQSRDQKLRVSAGGANLNDKVYYTQGVSTLGRYLGPPRQLWLSLAVRL
jgi:iron complex outermembrane recepter protein